MEKDIVKSCERDHRVAGTDVHHMVDITLSDLKMLFFAPNAINNVLNSWISVAVCGRMSWLSSFAIFLKLSTQ